MSKFVKRSKRTLSRIANLLSDPVKVYSESSKMFDDAAKAREMRFAAFDRFAEAVRLEYSVFKDNFKPRVLGEPFYHNINIAEEFHEHIPLAGRGTQFAFPEGSSLRFLQVSCSNIPAGVTCFSKKGNVKLIVEESGSLVFSQSPNGYIVIIAYPRRSEFYKRAEDYIIYKYSIDPTEFKISVIQRAFAFFALYCLESSVHGEQSKFFALWFYFISKVAKLTAGDLAGAGKVLGQALLSVLKKS